MNMKVVCSINSNDVQQGLGAALSAMVGVQIFQWDATRIPSLDMLDSIKPDLLICESKEIDRALQIGLEENKSVKLVVFGVHCPGGIIPSLLVAPPTLTPQQIGMINVNNKYQMVQIPPAANLVHLYGGKSLASLASDFLYISDLLPENVMPYLDTMHQVGEKHALRIAGPVKLPLVQYCGMVQLPTMCDMIKSTKIALDIGNKHLLDYAVNKTFCISTQANELFPVLSDGVDIKKFLTDPKLRNKYIKEAYATTIVKDTYFHRVADMMEKLGCPDMAQAATNSLNKVINE